MREIVILRDGQGVFPGCDLDAHSCDVDHIEPYLSPDDGDHPSRPVPPASAACAGDITG
jgi:hypothetical protein